MLDIDGRFTVTGPLETFANAGGVHVARALLGEFSANMARLVAERAPAAAPAAPDAVAAPAAARPPGPVAAADAAPSPPSPAGPTAGPPPASPPPARELSALRLAWLAFRSWLRSLLGKGTP